MGKKKEKIIGSLISYLTIVIQIIINLVLTPVLIKSMGLEEYGLYETINSFGNSFLALNFGVSSIISRYIVKNKSEDKPVKLENFLYMSTIISFIIFIIVLVLGLIASNFIGTIYNNSLSFDQIKIARTMFIYIVLNLAFFSWNNYTTGIINGYEKFSFESALKLLRQILRVLIIIIMILIGVNAIRIIICDLIVTSIILLIEFIYCFGFLGVKIKYHFFDKKILSEVFLFSLASIIQTFTNQINLTLDKVILGVMMSTKIVALYSIGLLIINVTVSILQIINGVYLPDATRLVLKKASGEEMTKFVIKPGRIQAVIGCTIFFGFALVGKDFLNIWVGKEFEQIWLSTIIMLFFVIISYVTSVANVILDAMLKKIYRSIILGITAILNIALTIFLIKPFGYFGAAIGTSISMLIGNIILLNIYYNKIIGLKILKIYKEIYKEILPCFLVAFIISLVVKLLLNNSFLSLFICAGTFIIIVFMLLIKFNCFDLKKIKTY